MDKKSIDLTGQVFDKLTVLSRADDIVSESGKNKYKTWLCKCDCGNEVIVKEINLKSKTLQLKSCGCVKAEKEKEKQKELERKREIAEEKAKAKAEVKRMTQKEQEDWDALYQYVRTNIMNYDEKQSLSTQAVLRLKGLLTNKFIENKGVKDTANYSYEVILNTFKYCYPDIQKGLKNNNFKDNEMYKINYIIKIVEPKINTVYMRMKNAKKSEEKIETFDMSHTENYTAKFKPKESTKIKTNKFDDLW